MSAVVELTVETVVVVCFWGLIFSGEGAIKTLPDPSPAAFLTRYLYE